VGADAYVVKPFDPEYLFALIRSMLKNRDNVRQILEKNTKIETNPDIIISEMDM
jgi:DNA-binding response OmpR family regulator